MYALFLQVKFGKQSHRPGLDIIASFACIIAGHAMNQDRGVMHPSFLQYTESNSCANLSAKCLHCDIIQN